MPGGFLIGSLSLSSLPLSAIKPLQIPTMGLEIMSNERVRVAYTQWNVSASFHLLANSSTGTNIQKVGSRKTNGILRLPGLG